jgi:uncharacterized protein YdiU (UPF0061 family)
MMQAKLGLAQWQGGDDDRLLEQLHAALQAGEIDMTLFFRTLAGLDEHAPEIGPFEPAFYDPVRRQQSAEALQAWLVHYAARLRQEGRPQALRKAEMNAANPLYVPRNYLAQQAIDAAEQGDLSELELLMKVLRTPYREQPGYERFAARRPDWARARAGCSMLSCSS